MAIAAIANLYGTMLLELDFDRTIYTLPDYSFHLRSFV